MSYGKRIDTLCALLTPAKVFADVGCDHGYCSEYMLQKGLCEKVILSDISKGSLAKAEALLASYIEEGRATSVLGNGFFGVPSDVDEVLIAGMGGSEICSILSDKKYGFMPKRFVFQPMHDAEKLRRYILGNGGYIDRDFTFEDVKYYDVICGGGADNTHVTAAYTDREYEFGRENLQTYPDAFVRRCKKRITELEKCLQNSNLQESSRMEILDRKKRLEGALQP